MIQHRAVQQGQSPAERRARWGAEQVQARARRGNDGTGTIPEDRAFIGR
jgi:hypothetical protein